MSSRHSHVCLAIQAIYYRDTNEVDGAKITSVTFQTFTSHEIFPRQQIAPKLNSIEAGVRLDSHFCFSSLLFNFNVISNRLSSVHAFERSRTGTPIEGRNGSVTVSSNQAWIHSSEERFGGSLAGV